MMTILVLGGRGMLGHKLFQILNGDFNAFATVRSNPRELEKYSFFCPDAVLGGVDAFDFETIEAVFARIEPDVVVNCVGIVKQQSAAKDPIATVTVNALFPHRLHRLCRTRGTRLIHISTDCVFSGRKGGYGEGESTDAEDLYGKTKALGEVSDEGALTLRTSIIGRELTGASGLVEWFLSNRNGAVKGYTEARFSGLTTEALARTIHRLITDHPRLHGLYQVSAAPIDKHALLCMLRDAYRADIAIEPDASVKIDRTLNGSRFIRETGINAPSWEAMVEAMAMDPTPYDTWRTQ